MADSAHVSTAASGVNPGFPNTPSVVVFGGFEGMDTKPGRSQIDSKQCSWMENVQPMGNSTARSLYGAGTPIYTAGGKTVIQFGFVGLYNNDTSTFKNYCLIVCSDGSVDAVLLDTGVLGQDSTRPLTVTTIASAGTLNNVSSGAVGINQFGSQCAIIVNNGQTPNHGYFLWDGTLFYTAGGIGPQVIIDRPGTGYSSAPTATVLGGSGGSAGLSATVANGSVNAVTVTAKGSGFSIYDRMVISFSGGNAAATARATATITSGIITGIVVDYGGLGYSSTSTATAIGGGGGGAILAPVVVNGAVTSITITQGGAGFVTAPTLDIADPNSAVAHGYVATMPEGMSATTVESYQGHVWVAGGQVVNFSAPNSASDFYTGDGAGAFSSTDGCLKNTYTALVANSGFLLLFGDSSISYLSGVSTTSGATSFTLMNINPTIGLSWPLARTTFSDRIVFANYNGVFHLSGSAVQKLSAPVDRIWPSQATVGSFLPSMAGVTLNNVECFCLLIPVIDPISNAKQTKLLCSDGQHWWSATQEHALTQIATYGYKSLRTAYGTDGVSIYPLFQTPSTSLLKTLQSKLFDGPGYWYTKVLRRLFGQVKYFDMASGALTATMDHETGAVPIAVTMTPTALGLAVLGPYALSTPGALRGLTVTTSAADIEFYSFAMVEQVYTANI